MTDLRHEVRTRIDDERAPRFLSKYYAGRYTGALFDTAPSLRSSSLGRFTAHDIAAVATLSVPMSGRAVAGLIEREDTLAGLLERVRPDLDLADATDDDLDALFALQREIDKVADIGHVTRSKLLAHKRPLLVPIRDQYVLTALLGRDHGDFTRPLRDLVAADRSILDRLRELRQIDTVPDISLLRVLDVVVWMTEHGDRQVADWERPPSIINPGRRHPEAPRASSVGA
jgi:hypothetical protein